MTAVSADGEGRLAIEAPAYRLQVERDGLLATLSSPEGRHWASLRLLAALDCADGRDETLSVEAPRMVDTTGAVIEIERRSTRWERATLTLACGEHTIDVRARVSGRGQLTDAHLLGGRSLMPRTPSGFLPSGSSFRTLFSPNPGQPGRVLRSAAETAVIGVVGDSEPGRGHWFFTPAPLYFALHPSEGLADPGDDADGDWLGIGIAGPVAELTFVEVAYRPADQAFSLVLDYDGHTGVDGDFETPAVVFSPGIADPYAGLRGHRDELIARGAAPAPRRRDPPEWWSAPIFCGWGAQCHLAASNGREAPELSTQANYDEFLAHLESHGVVPGTVIVDDKWQQAYGAPVPDPDKWPDLRGWIAERRSRGQRVLLWWNAWGGEALPAELCIRNPDGVPIALDPTNPATRTALRETVAEMLSPDGLDADGLKIDFTGNSPSGCSLSSHGPGWGIALLHDLLAVVYTAAKAAKPEALLITHTPHPSFVDVTDMLRLNDMLRLKDLRRTGDLEPIPPVVPQMRYRAAVVRAACPDLLIDTDDWCIPSRSAWREYVEMKSTLGVPSLYYATHFDLTGEALEPEDYDALRRTWEAWRAGCSTAQGSARLRLTPP